MKNFGVSGRTLLKKGDFPYWNEPQFQEVKDFSPDVVLIKLGTNDSKPQNWAHKAEFVQDYLDLIAEFRDHMPKDGKVYVILPVPVTRENFGINPEIMNNEQRLMLFEIIQKSGAEVIDLYTPLMETDVILLRLKTKNHSLEKSCGFLFLGEFTFQQVHWHQPQSREFRW